MPPKDETAPGAGPAPTSEFEAIGNTVNKFGQANGQDDSEDEKIVQEIESLCMNCHENVSWHASPASRRPRPRRRSADTPPRREPRASS